MGMLSNVAVEEKNKEKEEILIKKTWLIYLIKKKYLTIDR